MAQEEFVLRHAGLNKLVGVLVELQSSSVGVPLQGLHVAMIALLVVGLVAPSHIDLGLRFLNPDLGLPKASVLCNSLLLIFSVLSGVLL